MTTAGYGYQARIGLILPADNVVMEPELYALGLPGISYHGLRLTTTDHEEMRRQAPSLGSAVAELGLDLVVYACAETSFEDGARGEPISETIAATGGVPVVTATEAMLLAVEAAAVRRIALVTPYGQRSGDALVRTFRDNAIEVVAAVHHDFSVGSDDPREWHDTNRQPLDRVVSLARDADRPEADAVIIVSTNLPTLAVVDRIERELGKPVLTTNQSILWWCLRMLGLRADHPALSVLVGASGAGRIRA